MGFAISEQKPVLRRRRLGLLSVSASTLAIAMMLTPAMASAQTAASSPPAVTSENSSEIVVTARRRDETLSRSPVAITAFSAEQLVERAIRTDSDLQTVTPGLTIRQTQGNNSLTYSIRGQTADTFSGSPSAVITYLNEVPVNVNGASSFYDLQSVQVLKGPQGTLFGRNGTGGSVLYTSAQPTNDFEALIRGRVGNLNLREVDGMINVPIVNDRAMLRFAFNTVQRDGYIDDLTTGASLGEVDRDSGRLSLLLRPSDHIENATVLQGSRTDSTNTGASYVYSIYGTSNPADCPTNNGFALNCVSGFLNEAPFNSVQTQRELGPYKTLHPGGVRHRGEDWMLTNRTNVDINDNLTFRNILGAAHSHTDSEQPQLGAAFATILTANIATGDSGNELDIDSISDEMQLEGRAGDLVYVVGVYYQDQQVDTVWPQTYFGSVTVTNAFRTENTTQAVYAQGTYDLAALTGVQDLRLTVGARYTREDVDFEVRPRDTRTDVYPAALLPTAAGASLVGISESKTFEDPSWEVGLEYQASQQIFLYAKTRGSFRSGGFNGAALPIPVSATEGGNLFDSEHTQDIEFGFKYRGELLGRPAALNFDIYNQWIQDVQRVEFPPDPTGVSASIAVTANVPSEQVRGLEIDGSFMPFSWLEVGGFAAATDAIYTNGNLELFGTPFLYGPAADTPKTSGVIYGVVYFPMDESMGEVTLRGEVYSQSSMFFSSASDANAPGTRLPGYTLVSGRLQWEDIMGSHVTAALFGKNLTDEEYFVGGMTLAAALGHNAAAVGEPRTYGIELSYRY